MAQQLFANGATTTLAVAIGPTTTSVSLTSGTGVLFPSPGAGQFFLLTFQDAATGLLNEIVMCTAISGDVATIVRAQEGTTAQSWSGGDLASVFVTAGTLANLLQFNGNNFPTTPGTIGSGVIWNNGGALCVS